MGQGANIIISNFSERAVQLSATEKVNVGIVGTVPTILARKRGLEPFYIEGSNDAAGYLTLSFAVMTPDGTSVDPAYSTSTARFKLTGAHWEADDHVDGALAVTVGVKEYTQDVLAIFLQPKTVTHHIRLHAHAAGDDVWECEMGSAGQADWSALNAETCVQKVFGGCRTVTLRISNASGRQFWLDGEQLDGSSRWQDELVESGAVWERSFDVTTLAVSETWEYRITGSYDPPSQPTRRPMPALFGTPGGGPRRPLPDPTFKITRSGG